MDKYEAEKIVNSYGGSIAETNSIFRKISTLHHPKAVIKQAYFVLLEAIIEDKKGLPKNVAEMLLTTYGMLNSFIDDNEAEKLSKEWKKVAKLPEGRRSEVFGKATRALRDEDLSKEIMEFIEACYKKYNIEST